MRNASYGYIVVIMSIVCFAFSCSGEQFQSAVGGADVNTGAANTIDVIRSDDGSENFFSVNKEFKASEFESVKLNLVEKDSFTQGVKGTIAEEEVKAKPLDILLIVDDSGSMREEHASLSTKLGALLSKVEHTDWRIAVTTTDYYRNTKSAQGSSAPCLISLIKKGDDNYENKFKNLFTSTKDDGSRNPDYIGLNGSNYEQGILKAVYALSQNIVCPDNESEERRNWLRPGSALAIVIVSDEDNCFDSNYSYSGLKKCLKAVRGYDNDGNVITWPVNGETKELPKIYHDEFITKLEGFSDYVSQADVAETELGRNPDERKSRIQQSTIKFLTDAISRSGRTLGKDAKVFGLIGRLTETTNDDGSVTVTTIKDEVLTCEPSNGIFRWTYQRLICESGETPSWIGESDYTTTFEKISESLVKLADVFPLNTNKAVDPDIVAVYVNNKKINASKYSLNTQTKEVSFKAGVINKDSNTVKVQYYSGSTRKNTFNLSGSALTSTIKVEVNGSTLARSKYSYNADDKTITLTPYPVENADIKISYLKLSPDSDVDSSLDKLKVYVGNELINRVTHDIQMDSIRLNNDTVSDIIKDGQRITNSSGLGELNQDTGVLKFNLKDVKAKDNLELSYDHLTKRNKVFVVEEINPNFVYTWNVLVDGAQAGYKDYKIKGNTVEFEEFLPINSTVSIQAYRTSK